MRIAAGVGLSQESDARRAARRAAQVALDRSGHDRADWGLIFATAPLRPHYAEMLAEIQEVLRTDSLSGCSAWGLFGGAEEIEGAPAVAVLAVRSDRVSAGSLIAPAGEDGGRAAGLELGRLVAGKGGCLVLMPDPDSVRPDHLLETIEEAAPGLQAIGAACSGDPRADRTFQFCGRNVATRSIAALHLDGAFRLTIGITQGCQPLGDTFRVTKNEGNVILELDGRPALDTLRSRLPEGLRGSFQRLSTHLYAGLPPDASQDRIDSGEYLVRHLIGADPERGSVEVGGSIQPGQLILLVLRDAQAAREDLKQMLDRITAGTRDHPPRFGLYFSCAGRGQSLYGVGGIDGAYLARAFGELPIIGFFGNAEIAPLRGANRLFTYTGVLALFSETGD